MYILDMTPGITDVYVQQEMVNRYLYCCNRETNETKCVLVQQSWTHSRLGEHLSWDSGKHVDNPREPFQSGICNHYQSELKDFRPKALQLIKVF